MKGHALVNVALLGSSFVTLLVIMDPLGNVPLFLALTSGRPMAERKRAAWQSVVAAGAVIISFALFGQQLLRSLGITLPALQGAGGLLLLLVALQLLTGQSSDPESVSDVNIALVPLGTPLIAGPGAIVATIVFVNQAGTVSRDLIALSIAIAGVLIIIYLVLRFSLLLLRLLGESGIHFLSRISGLLLSAIAVQLIADSVQAFVHRG